MNGATLADFIDLLAKQGISTQDVVVTRMETSNNRPYRLGSHTYHLYNDPKIDLSLSVRQPSQPQSITTTSDQTSDDQHLDIPE